VRVLGRRTFVVTSASGMADAPTGQPEPKLTPKRNQVKLCSLTVPHCFEAQLHPSVHDRTESSTDVGRESYPPAELIWLRKTLFATSGEDTISGILYGRNSELEVLTRRLAAHLHPVLGVTIWLQFRILM
jgi:hypothetical protein